MTHPELQVEQKYVDLAYDQWERIRSETQQQSTRIEAEKMGHHGQTKVQKEALLHAQTRRTIKLGFGNQPLVFGRIDLTDHSTFHIGRVGVYDETGDRILVDWRAPIAESFYRATQGKTMGLRRRRHLVCRGQRLVSLDDDLMTDDMAATDELVLMGEAALMSSMQRSRTGRMGDIVPTIQREQDAIIRSPLDKLLIVQGGPGTGKTVVALHRVAYLLYSYQRRLQGTSILLIGPNPVFLRYIEDVLPSLGEHQVKLVTPGAVVEGIEATAADAAIRSRVKGDPRMVRFIAAAVRRKQCALSSDLVVWHESIPLRLRVDESRALIDTVRAQGKLHNPSRLLLQHAVVRHLDPDGDMPELADHPRLKAALEEMWPIIKAASFFRNLFTSRDVLTQAAEDLFTDNEIDLLLHDATEQLSEDDVAIIDEIDAQLGSPPKGPRATDTGERSELKAELARQALADLEYMVLDEFMKADVIRVVERNFEEEFRIEDEEPPAIIEYAHIVVDEAQELSPMQWRMIARRCPSGSMTIVGDLGQASGPWGANSWDTVFPYLPQSRDRQVMTLSINYRTPAEVMDIASAMLRSSGVEIVAPRSVRRSEMPPVFTHTTTAMMGEGLRSILTDTKTRVPDGKTAIIVPRASIGETLMALAGELEQGEDLLDAPVAVFTVDQARGLEFDSVIIIEPTQILAEHANGIRALYVAMTRATKQLQILHTQPLPEGLGVG
ncbi:MAG: ATP-binding domain-containing protein [Actinomycetota bacterium]